MRGSRLPVALLSCLVALLAMPGLTGPAQATTAYKYWNYFHGAGADWKFATTGPDDFTPTDGSVEGWRYGISNGDAGREPRTAPSFAAICASTPAESGKKRVAVVIDYGTADEAPSGETPPAPVGECAVVATSFNGSQVLDSVADVRIDKGTCGIDGYPASGCFETVKNATIPSSEPTVQLQIAGASPSAATPSGTQSADGQPADGAAQAEQQNEDDSSFPWVLVGAIVLVVVIGTAGFVTVRRRAA